MFEEKITEAVPQHAYPTKSKDISVLRTLMDAPGGVLSINLREMCRCCSLSSNIFRLRDLGWNILSIEQPPLLIGGEEIKRLVKYVLVSPYWNDPQCVDVDYQVALLPKERMVGRISAV